MTRRELEYVLKVLSRIKDPDAHVFKAVVFVQKDLATYDARRGQLRDTYDSLDAPW